MMARFFKHSSEKIKAGDYDEAIRLDPNNADARRLLDSLDN